MVALQMRPLLSPPLNCTAILSYFTLSISRSVHVTRLKKSKNLANFTNKCMNIKLNGDELLSPTIDVK